MLNQNKLKTTLLAGLVVFAPALVNAGAGPLGAARLPGADIHLAQAQPGGEAAKAPSGQAAGKSGGANTSAGRDRAGSSGSASRSQGANAQPANRARGDGQPARATVERRVNRGDGERAGSERRVRPEVQRRRVDNDRRGDGRRGTRFYWGPGAEFFFYDGYYHGDCEWLKRKARQTGSHYCLRRYRLCRAAE